MLVEMLKRNTAFLLLPVEKQQVFAKLAMAFEKAKDSAIYMSPEQLVEELHTGNRDQWFEFINLESVQAFVRAQMGFAAQIAVRQNFKVLTEKAKRGLLEPAESKEMSRMAGLLGDESANKIVVLHRVNRPSIEWRKDSEGNVEQTQQAMATETSQQP